MKGLVLLMAVAWVGAGCAHTRQPERRIYVISERGGEGSSERPGIGGAGADAYCNELKIQCHRRCMRRAPKYSSIKKGSPEHNRECTSSCLKEFMDCVKKQEELERQEQKRELRFPHIDGALDWLRKHETEIAVGTVVVVAGVAFVVATGGAGALLLVPLAL